jgi:hypothetical protein
MVCGVRTSAAEFDRWYADRVESPVVDELARRVLGLPPELLSTSLLSGAGSRKSWRRSTCMVGR